MDVERVPQFLTIISQIQAKNKSTSQKLERILIEKAEEVKELRLSFKEDTVLMRDELKETRVRLDEALKREIELLRELLEKRK